MASAALLANLSQSTASTVEQTAWIDLESPAGRGASRRRALGRYTHTYRGGGDPHLIGQPCDVVEVVRGGCMCEVVFACGCGATVPSASLTVN
jgi:hypothetical protein